VRNRPITDHANDVEVTRVCFDLSSPSRLRVGPVLPAFAVAMAVLVRDEARPWRLLAWLGVVIGTTACQIAVDTEHRRRRRRSVNGAELRTLMVVCSAASGLACGFAVLLPATPGNLDTTLAAMLFLAGATVVNLAMNSWARPLFVSFQAPVCVIPVVVLSSRGDLDSLVLGATCIGFLLFSTVLHRAQLDSVRNAVRMETSNVALAAELDHAARHDGLTGLPNRAGFTELVNAALAETVDGGVGVVSVNLDRFGVVNDSLGHGVGDELMAAVAERLTARCAGLSVARTGGDELSVLVSGQSPGLAERTAEMVAGCFAEAFVIGSRALTITGSVGVAIAEAGLDSGADLLRHSDAALRKAKRTGRDRIVVFDDRARRAIANRVDDEADLRRALAAGEIVAWFQPIVNLESGSIVGAEALARWIHPTRGLVAPVEFIALAEECGLIGALGSVVFESACRLRSLLDGFGVASEFSIRVNVSAHQLVMSTAEAFVAGVRSRGFDPQGISFEVTEGALAADPDLAIAVLGRLRSAGHSVALDDFGTGFSSLSLVQKLPIDAIKIDRSFVSGMVMPANYSLVEVIVAMADRLGLSVVAEGVENRSQVELLTAMGVGLAQGFLWSPAVNGDDLCRFMLRGAPWAQLRSVT
jgi:diguanylate cyclase (GGDEF)-like protein